MKTEPKSALLLYVKCARLGLLTQCYFAMPYIYMHALLHVSSS